MTKIQNFKQVHDPEEGNFGRLRCRGVFKAKHCHSCAGGNPEYNASINVLNDINHQNDLNELTTVCGWLDPAPRRPIY